MMTKKITVDVDNSMAWNVANGRVAPAPKEEYSHLKKHKIFRCPKCLTEHDVASGMFGEKVVCPDCGNAMQEKF